VKLDSTFAVTAPVDQVWTTLMDFEKVAGCVPGAQVLSKLSEDAYQVGMKVKLGPVTMQYKGQMEVLERDAGSHRAVLQGQAKEARGQGTAQATAHLALVTDGPVTRGTVSADIALSGKAAAMGQGVIGNVTDQMMEQFAQNLQVMLNGSSPAPTGNLGGLSTAAALEEELRQDNALGAGAGAGAPSAAAPPAAGPTTSEPVETASSLDALTLVRGVLGAELQEPSRVVQVLALVALVAYALGKRSVRRDRDRWVALLAAARE
jgi:carbon monoxide dehydrogenase subunit G